ncbi:MAG: hypothetical protein ACYCUD_07620 [Candidatus Dormibacteria bacterium]
MEQRTDIVGWELELEGQVATVREDGLVETDDPELERYLRKRLHEPVTVYRRGTVSQIEDDPAGRLTLRPGDGRYVAACVRSMAAEADGVQILRIVWNR